jgi:transglutaminase-like putative cysteine protease
VNRRDFVKLACLAPALFSLSPGAFAAPSRWRTFRLTYRVQLPEEGLPARMWLPLPAVGPTPYQMAMGSVWSGTAEKAAFTADRRYGAPIFYAEWNEGGPRKVEVVAQVRTADRSVPLDKALPPAPIPAEVRQFLRPTPHMPNDGIVREKARSITRGKTAPLEKARAIYDWVVDNTFRDPKVQACGTGDIKFMLESGNLGGKCADINSLFVGLARAAGIPAREAFGIRVAESGVFKSLGRSGDVSGAQHCRAEFYLAGAGWVPVDPADVRKAVLEEKLDLADPKIIALRERLFGNWEMNWVAFNHARDFALEPEAAAGPQNYFMYPYAEIGGKPHEGLNPLKFVYRVEAEEIV